MGERQEFPRAMYKCGEQAWFVKSALWFYDGIEV
jgi:hypothetical protein